MDDKQYYVYILTNKNNTTLYIGFTGKILPQRIWEHKQKLAQGFTSRYNLNKLVYYEIFGEPNSAIAREKQLKAGSRQKKMDLIQAFNPNWTDLYNLIA